MSVIETLKNTVMGAVGQNTQLTGMATQLLGDGGIEALVEKFNGAGLGEVVKSWISNGQNLPISAEQLQKVFSSEQLQSMATKFGIDSNQLTSQLTGGLPQLIDKLTPDGQMPSMDQLTEKLKALM